MADNTKDQPLPQESPKPAHLREVEEDAIYITNKRFADQQEELKRDAAQKARQDAKN